MNNPNYGYTRRQELTCTLEELVNYSNVILLKNEVLYVRQDDGTYDIKIGDGVTKVSQLQYVIRHSELKHLYDLAKAEAVNSKDYSIESKDYSQQSRNFLEANTSKLNNMSERISKNDKRITNLEKGLMPDPFFTDNSVAYVKTVPENALPYAEVTKIGGMTRKCTNLIDGANKSLETHVYNVSITAGDYICIVRNPNGSLDGIRTGVTFAATFRDASGAVIVSAVHNGVTITAEQASQISKLYVAFDSAYYTGGFATVTHQLNRGLVALPYEPYFEGLRSAPVSELVSEGANLFNIDEHLGDKVTKIDESSFTHTGVSSDILASVPVIVGKTYTVSGYIGGKNAISGLALSVMDGQNTIYANDDSLLGIKTGVTMELQYVSITFVAVSDYISLNSIGREVKELMLNIGDTALPYRPYFKRTLPIPEAVRPANGINENVYDYIEWCEDGTRKKHKCVEKVVFDGTEPWLFSDNQYVAGYTRWDVSMSLQGSKYEQCLCNKYESTSANKPGCWFNNQVNANFQFRIATTEFATVDELKTQLAKWYADGDPLTVIYAIAEPEVTDISDILTADNLVEVQAYGSMTPVNEFGYAVPTEITYQLKEITE